MESLEDEVMDMDRTRSGGRLVLGQTSHIQLTPGIEQVGK